MSLELTQKLTAAVNGVPAFPSSVQTILKLARERDSYEV